MLAISLIEGGLFACCLALPLLLAICVFSFRQRRDIIELYETKFRLLGVAVLCATLVVANTYVGLRLLMAGLTHGHWQDLLLGVVSLGPLVTALVSYLALEWRYARAYGRWLPIETMAGGHRIAEAMRELCDEMDIPREPAIRVSPMLVQLAKSSDTP